MKKLIFFSTILSLTLVLAGCSEVPGPSDDNLVKDPNGGMISIDSTKTSAQDTDNNIEMPNNSSDETQNTKKKIPQAENQIIPVKVSPYFDTKEITFNGVKWIPNQDILTKYKDAMINAGNKELHQNNGGKVGYEWEYLSSIIDIYEVGTINKAPYEKWKLIVVELQCEGPCFTTDLYRFAYNPETQKLVLLKKHSSEEKAPAFFEPLVKDLDTTFTVKSLTLPTTVKLADGKGELKLSNPNARYQSIKTPYTDLNKIAFTDKALGEFYFAAEDAGIGCLYLKNPDGSISTYTFDHHFFDENNKTTISWNDKSKSTIVSDTYDLGSRGCGIMGNCYFTEKADMNNLEVVGQTSYGLKLYMPKGLKDFDGKTINLKEGNSEQKKFNEAYITYLATYEYTADKDKKTLLTYEEFIKLKPLLFWQDNFGRWSYIIHNDVKPMAECGKPVIYLYPEKTTDVNVQVHIDEFTVTIPDYGKNGWTVRAEPNGELYNYADQKTYPYLFWEGIKKDNITTEKGFVVAKEDLQKFLNDSLAKMGLNETEKKDFMEFWLPRMQDNREPYFFISFVGTKDFNKVAPLTIDPQPQTLIRVFMYYHPLSEPIKVESQELKSIPRQGFTVIEWGGTSSEPWQF